MNISDYIRKTCDIHGLHRIMENTKALNIEKFSNFGQLFTNIPQTLSTDLVSKINFLADLIYVSVLSLDDVLDDKIPYWKEALFFSKVIDEDIVYRLGELNSSGIDLWKYHVLYKEEFVKACMKEDQMHFQQLKTYTLDEFEEIAKGKASVIKIIPTAVALLADQPTWIPAFESSVDYFFIGLQAKDDLSDWRKDFKKHQYSYLISQVIYEKGWHQDIKQINEDALGRVIYYGGYAKKQLDLAIHYFENAKSAVSEMEGKQWENCLNTYIQECQRHQTTVNDLVSEQIRQISIKQ